MGFESQIHLTQPSRARFSLSLHQLPAVLLLGVNEIIHAERSLWHLTRLQKMEATHVCEAGAPHFIGTRAPRVPVTPTMSQPAAREQVRAQVFRLIIATA